MFLGSCLMRNNAAVCCGRICLIFLVVSGLTYGNHLRGSPQWCFLFLWCVVIIGMSRDWRVSIQAIVLLHRGILRSLYQRIICESSPVHLKCMWMPGCVTPGQISGWSCRWSLLTLGILGGPTWVSHAMLWGFSIAMLVHFHCIPIWHMRRHRTIALLMVWQRLCCLLGTPW